MKYVIGGILLLIVCFIIGLIWRKKVYDEVDRLESWKMDIMNRRVTDELSKVKNLNLSGETQEKFEAWRNRWDQILTRELPELEEDLFDAEEAADRYQWKRVKVVIAQTEEKLLAVEEDINAMFEELEVLLDSEKSSRIEIESIQPELKELSKTLIQNRHQYAKAVSIFESRVQQLEEHLQEYETLAAQGDYIEANQLVQTIKVSLMQLKDDITAYPAQFKKATFELPEQLSSLRNGLKEMEEEGYRVSHFEFLQEIHTYDQLLHTTVAKLDEGDQDGIEDVFAEVENRLHTIYQALEREAVAHNYVEKNYQPLESELKALEEVLSETQREMEEIQITYQLEDEDIESHRGLKNWFAQLHKRLGQVNEKRQDGETAFSNVREELEHLEVQVKELKEKHKTFNERVQTLRKDEREAKQKLSDMEQLLFDTHRRLKRSNLPGIPSSIYEMIQTSSEKIDEVFQSLDQHPLDMIEVLRLLDEAVALTEEVHTHAEETMDKASLAERVIQYANRYRSQHPLLAAKLLEAEKEFRSFHYDGALELASEALKDVDPHAISRIEEQVEVLV